MHMYVLKLRGGGGYACMFDVNHYDCILRHETQ